MRCFFKQCTFDGIFQDAKTSDAIAKDKSEDKADRYLLGAWVILWLKSRASWWKPKFQSFMHGPTNHSDQIGQFR